MLWKLYLIALPVFFAIDMVWLGLVAKAFYARQIGPLMRAEVQWLPAVLFYLLFLAGLVFFVIAPAVEKRSWMYALLAGAFFGMVAYATYDLTNLAILNDWPLMVTLVDVAWGGVLTGSVAVITYLIADKIGLCALP